MEADRLFTPLERQVIVLAATHAPECRGLSDTKPGKGWIASMLHRFVPDVAVEPFANERLEALRRLTCACFASRGRPDEQVVRAALSTGLKSKQIVSLNGLARRYSEGN